MEALKTWQPRATANSLKGGPEQQTPGKRSDPILNPIQVAQC